MCCVAVNIHKLCTVLYTLGSPCGGLVLTAGVEVRDGVVGGGHLPKCILVVLLSLMDVVVLTTTVKLYLVPH